jgi:hypothetical protein
MTCNQCGFEGSMEDFLAENGEDTICPKCNEKDDHTYEV